MSIRRLPRSAVAAALIGLLGATPAVFGQTTTAATAPPATPVAANKTPAKAAVPVQPLIPAPSATQAEVEHIARFDAAIAPVRDQPLAAEDATRIRDAAAAFAANDPAKGRALAAQIADPVGRKLVDWVRLKVGLGEVAEYQKFLQANPAWPERVLLIQRMEEALFTQGGSARAIRDFFAGAEPKTGVGVAALASASLAEGDIQAATRLAAKAWRTMDIPATFETAFLERFGSLLTEADHKWRLDRYIVDDIRWAGERNERAAFARRIIPKLSPPEQKKAEARLAVFTKAPLAPLLMNALADDAKPDWGLTYHRIQHLRRNGRGAEAAKQMLAASTDPALVANLDDWWEERRVHAYDALKAGNAQLAYDLVKAPGPLSVNPLKDQSFLAGWLMLRHLGNAKAAEPHFKALRAAADGPLSLSRGDYWLGRIAEALGDRARADEHYTAGARYVDTFHGQLCRQKVAAALAKLEIKPPKPPTSAELAAFNGSDAVRAAVIARRAGLEPGIIRAFVAHFMRIAQTEGEAALTAHLAEALGDTQMAVRLGKLAIGRGFDLYTYAYPIHPMPAYRALRAPPESALLLGIARQESEFNTRTVSGAGARGILQVMPVTARHVCRDYKIKCELDRLLTDGAYNTSIASAYITDRMAEFQGSYVLTFAGYNAGPGRARQWIREFGDPRDPKVDPVDWIHRIPFEETREYVQKVMSNLLVYRARLGEAVAPARIADDLARARGKLRAPDPVASPEPEPQAAPRGDARPADPFTSRFER